jgi:hypothetical protein
MAIKHQEGYPFAFEPRACNSCPGKCCTGKSGYIWATPDEVEAMSQSLGLSFAEFATRYTYRERGRFSLKEVQRTQGDFACIFFDRGCKIYDVRPEQCRTFPFWDTFRREPRLVKGECPGIVDIPNGNTK